MDYGADEERVEVEMPKTTFDDYYPNWCPHCHLLSPPDAKICIYCKRPLEEANLRPPWIQQFLDEIDQEFRERKGGGI